MLAESFFYGSILAFSRKTVNESIKIFVEHTLCCVLLGYSSEPRPNIAVRLVQRV